MKSLYSLPVVLLSIAALLSACYPIQKASNEPPKTTQAPTFAPGQDPRPSGSQWVKVDQLSDEFNTNTINLKKWQTQPEANDWNWIGRPPALFKASNVKSKDGKMQITVGKLTKPVSAKQKNYTYQGAIVRSIHPGKVGWYYEARMKANQTVMSSTFWLMTKPGSHRKKLELDIQECVGTTTDKTANWGKDWDQVFHSNAIHRVNAYNPKRVQLEDKVTTKTKNWKDFYVYGAWWKSPSEIRFYLNGEYTYSINPKVKWDVPAFLQMAVETYHWNPIPKDGGLVESGSKEARTTEYDWIRTWKLQSKGKRSF